MSAKNPGGSASKGRTGIIKLRLSLKGPVAESKPPGVANKGNGRSPKGQLPDENLCPQDNRAASHAGRQRDSETKPQSGTGTTTTHSVKTAVAKPPAGAASKAAPQNTKGGVTAAEHQVTAAPAPATTTSSLKIKVRLMGGDEGRPLGGVSGSTSGSADAEPRRKIVLSLKKPDEGGGSPKHEGPIDIETVERPAKKARPPAAAAAPTAIGAVGLASSVSATAPKVKQVKAPSAGASGRPPMPKSATSREHSRPGGFASAANQSPFSNIPVVAKGLSTAGVSSSSSSSSAAAAVTSPATNLALAHMRAANLTRVPIAALSSLTTMTPMEREEERLTRQCLGETFGALWPLVTRPEPSKIYPTLAELESRIMAYWLMLAPVDSAFNAPSLKPPAPAAAAATATTAATLASPGEGSEAPVAAPPDREARALEEAGRLHSRFRAFVINCRNKTIPSELLVLEQRLCLEEEKFLYAKLKSEYNKKVSELIQKKRIVEGPTATPLTASSSVSHAAAMATIAASMPQQRILPRVVAPSAMAAAAAASIPIPVTAASSLPKMVPDTSEGGRSSGSSD